MKNNTIALLIGVLIVISISSFFIAPENIGRITGLASGASSTSFNLTEEVSLKISGSVNFGAGRVYPNASSAILESSLGYLYSYNIFDITEDNGPRPNPRWTNAVYDQSKDIFVIYGSSFPDTLDNSVNETWTFNLSNGQWTNISTAKRPPVYANVGLVYDSSINSVVLYGALPRGTYKLNSSNDWENLNPSPLPSAGTHMAMAFDSSRNVSVLFGGVPSSGEQAAKLNETWEYNASLNLWVNRTANVGASPTQRAYCSMAFDSSRNVSVLFGGVDMDLSYLNETWEYNGASWSNVTGIIPGKIPAKRSYPAMTYDSLRKKVILFAGNTAGYLDDAWEYNGTNWANTTKISEARRATIAFDSKANKSIIFYGQSIYVSSTLRNDTFEYNATDEDFNPLGAINGTWIFSRGFISIENDGTVNISVNYTANKNAGQFIGGTSPSFMIKGVAAEANACPDLNTTYAEVPNSTQTPNVLCPMLKFQNDADLFKVPVNLTVPSDVPSGAKNATITFSAVKA